MALPAGVLPVSFLVIVPFPPDLVPFPFWLPFPCPAPLPLPLPEDEPPPHLQPFQVPPFFSAFLIILSSMATMRRWASRVSLPESCNASFRRENSMCW